MAKKGKAGKAPQAKTDDETATAATEVAETKPAAPAQPKQNGVTMPRSNTQTGRVWEIADQLSKDAGQPASRADVLKAFEAEGGNSATGATQYGRWKKFYGITAPKKPKAEPATEAENEDAPEVEDES